MLLNVVRFAAKYEIKSINIHTNCKTKPFRAMKHMAKKGKITIKK